MLFWYNPLNQCCGKISCFNRAGSAELRKENPKIILSIGDSFKLCVFGPSCSQFDTLTAAGGSVARVAPQAMKEEEALMLRQLQDLEEAKKAGIDNKTLAILKQEHAQELELMREQVCRPRRCFHISGVMAFPCHVFDFHCHGAIFQRLVHRMRC